MGDLLPSGVRARGIAFGSERLFDIVIRRKGNAGGGVLASRLLRSRRRDSDGRLRFHKPIGVLRVDPEKDLRRATFVGNSSKRSDPSARFRRGHVRIEF
jgi:hypothetical protein